MKTPLRIRILLSLLPLWLLMAVLGLAAVFLLQRLGGRIDVILRENYDSVRYMERLKEALERIDSSYTFALAGQEAKAREQYAQQWLAFDKFLALENGNITLPGEKDLVDKLTRLSQHYRRSGNGFYDQPANDASRRDAYFGRGGLLATFKEMKDTADEILRINQENMEQANQDAKEVARESIVGLIAGLALATILGGFLAWRAVQIMVAPIHAVTRSAQSIRGGNLDQVVPVVSHDEIGELAREFNAMARQLRQYRQTDYARLLRTQRTTQATIDSFPDPVLVVDPEGKVDMANPAAQRLFGFPSAPTEHANPWLPPSALQNPLKEALQQQQAYLPEEFDRAVSLQVDGKDRSFLPHILPIRDPYGATLGAAVLLQDITRFRMLDRIKSDLVATASHELKTPLTSIRLAHHVLLEEAIGPLNAKQTELLLDARDNSERLLAVVNNLLDLTRLEQGREYLDLRPAPPAEILRAVAAAIQPRAEDREISVTVEASEDLPRVEIDQQRFGHALGNLLDNALTYTDRGGRVTLSAKKIDGHVELTIADTGIGIPPEYQPHVFERFSRIPNQSRGAGTGLGLAIVREIVSAHRGSVECESEVGKGSTFRIRLPSAPNPS